MYGFVDFLTGIIHGDSSSSSSEKNEPESNENLAQVYATGFKNIQTPPDNQPPSPLQERKIEPLNKKPKENNDDEVKEILIESSIVNQSNQTVMTFEFNQNELQSIQKFHDACLEKLVAVANIKTRISNLNRMQTSLQKTSLPHIQKELSDCQAEFTKIKEWFKGEEKNFKHLHDSEEAEYTKYHRTKFTAEISTDLARLGLLEAAKQKENEFFEKERIHDKQQAKLKSIWESLKFRISEVDKLSSPPTSKNYLPWTLSLASLPKNTKENELDKQNFCIEKNSAFASVQDLLPTVNKLREEVRLAQQAFQALHQTYGESFQEELDDFTTRFEKLTSTLIEKAQTEKQTLEILQKQFNDYNFSPAEEQKQAEFLKTRTAADLQKEELPVLMNSIKERVAKIVEGINAFGNSIKGNSGLMRSSEKLFVKNPFKI